MCLLLLFKYILRIGAEIPIIEIYIICMNAFWITKRLITIDSRSIMHCDIRHAQRDNGDQFQNIVKTYI